MTEILRGARLGLSVALLCGTAALAMAQGRSPRGGDYIVAVVNQELVTAVEVEQRLERAREAARQTRQPLPPEPELRKQVVDSLIDERVVITYARESSSKVEEPELDRAVQNVASQNQLNLEQLRARLRDEGLDYGRFRANLRDQIMVERVREREVYQRIRVTDGDIDKFVEEQRQRALADAEVNVAQILVTVPEGANETVVAQRRAIAEQALARVRGGEAFEVVVRAVSEDGNRERGGAIGLRPLTRLPDLFADAVRNLKEGDVTPGLLRSGAGFHVLKVLERREGNALRVTQTRVRHILLRVSDQLTPTVAAQRLAEFRRQIESNQRGFEDIARQVSEDGSAAAGGDLGWAAPGQFVPEFEEAMNRLPPGGLSQPVVSRFGVHLIQVLERRDVALDPKAVREQARAVLREQKFDEAFAEWAKDLRTRAYIEMREPPF